MERFVSEQLISSKIESDHVVSEIIIRTYIRDADNAMIKRTVKRTTTTTRSRKNIADTIVPFGKAATSRLLPIIGEEVHFELPPKKTPAIVAGPHFDYIEDLINKSLPLDFPASSVKKFNSNLPEPATNTKPAGSNTFAAAVHEKNTEQREDSDTEYQQTLFIDNIPTYYDRSDVTNLLLDSCTEIDARSVKRINIVYDKETGESRGQVFIMLDSPQIAEYARDTLHEGRIPGSGCVISVKIAKPPRDIKRGGLAK